MQETVSMIHDEILDSKVELSSHDYRQLIQKYALRVCNTPVPPIPWERFSLSFNLTHDQSVLTFNPPVNTSRTVLDLDLSTLLLTLNIGKLLDVLAAILTQQPIIFFSANYSTLVTSLECLLYLIYPLKWVHVYVPLVPEGLRDYYLEGPPGSYIMGAHVRHQSIVEELNSSVTCNLDNDKHIRIPDALDFHRIPPSKLQRFADPITKLLDEIKKARSLQSTHSLVRLRIDQQREHERQHRLDTNRRINEIFLDLMVDLCGDALKPIFWKMEYPQTSPSNSLRRASTSTAAQPPPAPVISRKTFSRENYLKSKTEGIELEFYRVFVDSTAFQLLMNEEKLASPSSKAFRRICSLRLASNEEQLYHFNNTSTDDTDDDELSRQLNMSVSSSDTVSSQLVLPLPDWPSNMSSNYLDSCLEVFTHELQHAQEERSPPVITVYAYLRGCALLARGELLNGLRDLYLIENPHLFPHEYIEATIIPILSDSLLLDLFLNEPFYIKSAEWKKVHTQPTSQHMSIIDLEKSGNSLDDSVRMPSGIDGALDEEWTVSETNLSCEQFREQVHRLSIALDKDTAETLFNALLHWTDHSAGKTMKKDKTLTNANSKTADATKRSRSWSTTTYSLAESLAMSKDHRRDSQLAPATPKSTSSSADVQIPAPLFERFLDVWQKTNAEKVRMNHYLPEDRQKQESILKVEEN